jgi:hypothetical protein
MIMSRWGVWTLYQSSHPWLIQQLGARPSSDNECVQIHLHAHKQSLTPIQEYFELEKKCTTVMLLTKS